MDELTESATRSLRRGGSSVIWARIVRSIKTQRAHLFYVTNGSYLVLQNNIGRLLILACAGNDATTLMKLCIQVAEANNCIDVIFYTKQKGLPRLLREFNPVQVDNSFYRIVI